MTASVPSFDAMIGQVAGSTTPEDLYGCRQERKLLVSASVAAALRAEVAAHLPLEQFVAGRLRTRIHSLYFDTPDFQLYRRSLAAGSAPSLKLRLRAYADAATPGQGDAAPFLEAKLGLNGTTGERVKRKSRLRLGPQKLARLMHPTAGRPITRRKAWQPLLAHLEAAGLRPCLTVSYEREAFQDASVRITFDEGYRAAPIEGAATPLGRPPGCLADQVVVEIKFLHAMPAWLLEALGRLGLAPEGQSFSKFKTAVALLYPQFGAPVA